MTVDLGESGPPTDELAQRPACRVVDEAQPAELSYVVLFNLGAICARRRLAPD